MLREIPAAPSTFRKTHAALRPVSAQNRPHAAPQFLFSWQLPPNATTNFMEHPELEFVFVCERFRGGLRRMTLMEMLDVLPYVPAHSVNLPVIIGAHLGRARTTAQMVRTSSSRHDGVQGRHGKPPTHILENSASHGAGDVIPLVNHRLSSRVDVPQTANRHGIRTCQSARRHGTPGRDFRARRVDRDDGLDAACPQARA